LIAASYQKPIFANQARVFRSEGEIQASAALTSNPNLVKKKAKARGEKDIYIKVEVKGCSVLEGRAHASSTTRTK
jgi:hypothetical protein